MLDGAAFANAMRSSGKPCRIRLPEDPASRTKLVDAHIRGEASELTFIADGHQDWNEHVDAVVLASLCPGADGHCRWVAIDLDADDHGEHGLADPIRAVRTIAERADSAGLSSGLLVARSRGGFGRHVLLMPPEPIGLPDAVVAVAAIVASAFRVAASDVLDGGVAHAFRCANGTIASPGDAGAVELIPRSTVTPQYGWALTLPACGAFRAHGGGVIVDPFEDNPIELLRLPRCSLNAWHNIVAEARAVIERTQGAHAQPTSWQSRNTTSRKLHPLTQEFLDGKTPKGRRNTGAFTASCNLLGCEFGFGDVERLVLEGARLCELPDREARAAIQSAIRAAGRLV
jgi:hypothetical protein